MLVVAAIAVCFVVSVYNLEARSFASVAGVASVANGSIVINDVIGDNNSNLFL